MKLYVMGVKQDCGRRGGVGRWGEKGVLVKNREVISDKNKLSQMFCVDDMERLPIWASERGSIPDPPPHTH